MGETQRDTLIEREREIDFSHLTFYILYFFYIVGLYYISDILIDVPYYYTCKQSQSKTDL